MAGTNAGNIYYDIEMDVKNLLSAQQQVNARLDSMERGFNDTTRAVESTERSFSSLSKISLALSAAMSVKQITDYATAWVDVNNKLANAVKANESLADVTSRVFDIAQSTKSDLQSTAALYGTLERATRNLGLSSDDLSSVIKTVNEGLVLSGATTQEAAGATLQLSQALASGALRGDEFNSVSENGSRIAQALADSLGVNIGQLKVMAGQGKLTSDVVINGLLSQGSQIAQEFNNHTTTLSQSLQKAGNNLTKFFGENATVNTFLSTAGNGIVLLSDHINALATVLSVAAVVMGGRYAAALTLSATASLKNTLATIEQSRANAQAAQAALLRAQFESRSAAAIKYSASVEVTAAASQLRNATTADAATAAQVRLSSARLAMADATIAATAATNNLTVAQSASAAASAASGGVIATLGRGALALIGGPLGFAMTAAVAIFYFKQRSDQAKQSANELADSVGGLANQFKSMNDAQLEQSIKKMTDSIPSLTDQLSDAQKAYKNTTYRVQDLQREISRYAGTTRGREAADALTGALENQEEAARDLSIATTRLSQTQNAASLAKAQLNGTLLQGADLLSRDNAQVSVADGLYRKFGQAMNIAAHAKQNFNSQSLMVDRPADASGYIQQLSDENSLLEIQDQKQRAIAKAKLDFQNKIKSTKGTDDYQTSTTYQADINRVGELAGKEYDLQQANAARQKQQKAGVTTANQQARAEDSVAQKLDALRQRADLTAISTDNLSLEQAKLQARLSLGKNATAAQIAESDRYTTSIWQQAAAIKARNLVPEAKENDDYQNKQQQLNILKGQTDSNGKLLISQQQYQQESERLAAEHIGNLAKINSQNVVTPQQSLAAQVDPVQQLANENAQKLELIKQFMTQRVITEQQGLTLMNAANTAYEKQRTDAQWALYTQQSTDYQALGAAVDGFGQSASSSIAGILSGTQNLSDALQNVGNSVLNGVVQTFVEMGMQWVKSAIMGAAAQEAASAQATAAQAAGIAATIPATVAAATASSAAWAPAALSASIATLGAATATGSAAYTTAMTTNKLLAVAGARKNGGPVSGNGIYQVGESGLPEIFKASNGSQYMIPGDNGRVISNKEMNSGQSGSSGGVNQTIHFNIQTTGGIDDATMAKMSQMMKQVSVATIRNEQRPNGLLERSR